ncbi:hypothetical protein S7711_11347 [Stachybotrys chartarum IBT 7711]|uniref:DUF6594 domain-containing protein n=1 Tax=Stachybotrys chartarum (strain CBS 109288 / IBT 7711) TaxID=1280523 RepID=A0A084B2P0_STACB|nr:hypothetical protein S7711_11347 [Stachybotrys chartarum IBT 7711]
MCPDKSNYAALAGFFSSWPDVLTIRRFRELQIRNLLFYQAELAHLEAELHELEDEDARQNPNPLHRVNFRWTPHMNGVNVTTATASNHGQGAGTSIPPVQPTPQTTASLLYRDKVLQIRRTLADYNDAVEQYKRLCSLPGAERLDMVFIHEWLNDNRYGNYFLAGDVEDVWTVGLGHGNFEAADASDFFTFEDQSKPALRLMSIVIFLHRFVSRFRSSSSGKIHHMDVSAHGVLDQAITTVAASIIPILPILIFYFVHETLIRIGLIIVFTAVFSVILVVGLRVKPHAALAITTAIAAIQVVYVGSTANESRQQN